MGAGPCQEDVDALVDLLAPDHAHAELAADRALRTVGGDHILRPHAGLGTGCAVCEGGRHALLILRAGDKLAIEAQLAGSLPLGEGAQHGLEVVLGAEAIAHRTDGQNSAVRPARGRGARSPHRTRSSSRRRGRVLGTEAGGADGGLAPHWRYISMVRALMARALGWTAVPAWRSTSSERTPCRERSIEAVRPTGPPPTIRTGTCLAASRLRWRARSGALMLQPVQTARRSRHTTASGPTPSRRLPRSRNIGLLSIRG